MLMLSISLIFPSIENNFDFSDGISENAHSKKIRGFEKLNLIKIKF